MNLYKLIGPLQDVIPPEFSHRMAFWALKSGLVPSLGTPDSPRLAVELWGRRFSNPLGIAAGFDKDAEAIAPLLALGFGFVEIGSVTPRPQPGNPKPRVFRLSVDRGAINRLGFNSRGQARAACRLKAFRATGRAGLVGINLGKNKDQNDAAADYAAGARVLGPYGDYLVINVSSPNTPGLRQLQGRGELEGLIAAVRNEIGDAGPPLLVKISPDLAPEDLAEIAALGLAGGVDGFIATNTTLSRPTSLKSHHRAEAGGLSGRPAFEITTESLRRLYSLTEGRIPLIGVGGISSGADAYAKIRAGASLVQLYTGLIYEGPGLVGRIKRDLADLLQRDGYDQLSHAVGADHREPPRP
ncbi:MAG: quinone-dependent dihydroorotate dehydrogenase [Pseudomonadota bacterium]